MSYDNPSEGHTPQSTMQQHPPGGRTRLAAAAPAALVALLPKIACPACWPAYAGLLSAMGVGAVNYSPYLLPLTIGGLALALAALGFRAKRRRGYGPLVLGTVGAAGILVGKFVFDWAVLLHGGVAVLVGASIWNAWPKAKGVPSCLPAGGTGTVKRETTNPKEVEVRP
jgi:hypothetical protein